MDKDHRLANPRTLRQKNNRETNAGSRRVQMTDSNAKAIIRISTVVGRCTEIDFSFRAILRTRYHSPGSWKEVLFPV